jgi:hypothetical protein
MQIVCVSDFTEGPTALNGKERSYRRLLAITELIALVDPEVTCLDEVGLRSGFLSFTEGLQEVLREVYSHGACDMTTISILFRRTASRTPASSPTSAVITWTPSSFARR